ncbi:MAG: hypothetical protein ACKVW3_10960 [Phycisphaerales bacterium]
MRVSITDPSTMSIEDRRRELAALLATGFTRLRGTHTPACGLSADLPPARLDGGGVPRLDGAHGLTPESEVRDGR